ncbi:MAG: hypothetical protein WCJ74_00240 [bacterium]
MSIHPILEKIKAFVLELTFETYLMILIIVLVGLSGFGLGKLSNAGEGRAVIIQTGSSQNLQSDSSNKPENTASAIEAVAENSNTNNLNPSNIVASKNGTKYYFSWCSGVGRIQDQNKVYFTSEQEAIDAGYTKASGCQ